MERDNEKIRNEIIEKIKMNKISTTEIADCLGKTGALVGINPVNRGHFRVGNVFLAYAYGESNWELHEQIRDVAPGDVVIVEVHGCNDRAIFGSLVTKYIMLYKRATAVVVNGNMRDAHHLIKEDYPVWCKELSPVGCFNRKNAAPLSASVVNSWKQRYNGAIALCDDCGVVIIPPESINAAFLEKLDFIELQEDIWNYCVNTMKWSTYDTVCLKKYLDLNLLPKEYKEKFIAFVNKTEK